MEKLREFTKPTGGKKRRNGRDRIGAEDGKRDNTEDNDGEAEHIAKKGIAKKGDHSIKEEEEAD